MLIVDNFSSSLVKSLIASCTFEISGKVVLFNCVWIVCKASFSLVAPVISSVRPAELSVWSLFTPSTNFCELAFNSFKPLDNVLTPAT